MKIKKILSLILNLIFFAAGSIIIFAFAYRYGWLLLKGPVNWGNDFSFALSYVSYIDRWWPNIPRWHYEWTGGMPLLRNYPFLITLLTVWTEHITNFSVIQIARFYFWLSIPLSGIGIMLFTRLITKNWIIAIMAGVFSFLSPDPWAWIIAGGFYSASTSFPFMTFTFFFFELAFQKEKRIWWVVAIILLGLTWTAHPVTGVATSVALFVYALGRGIAVKKVIPSLSKTIAVSVSSILLMSFWTIPFAFSRPGGTGVSQASQVPYITLTRLLGLKPPKDFLLGGFFSDPILVLAAMGLIFALIRRSKMMVCALTALVGIFLVSGPGYIPWLLKGPILTGWGMMNVRAIVIPRLFLPILAAYGAIAAGEIIFLLIGRFAKGLKENLIYKITAQVLAGVIGLIIVLIVFQKVIVIPQMPHFYLGYGPVFGTKEAFQKVDGQWRVNNGKDVAFPSLTESLKLLLNLKVDDPAALNIPKSQTPNFIKEAGLTENDRIDIFDGATTASWNFESGVAQVNPYVGTSLITPMFGYEVACIQHLVDNCNSREIQSLAKWWGIKLFYIGAGDLSLPKTDQLTKKLSVLQKAGFIEKAVNKSFLTYQVPNPTGLATISNKPLILVIGNNPPYNDGFRSTFYSFNRSMWNYDKAMLVEGKRYVDDYSLEDLKKFDVLVLYGYQTHNKEKSWNMLSKYVEEGGNIFVETGWQYYSQDWGSVDSMPSLLPVSKTEWGEIGTKWNNLKINNDVFGIKPSSNEWADLVWDKKPWKVAASNTDFLREGSSLLVTSNDKIIIAGRTFGAGKVVWSGMNFFGHTAYYANEPENEFLSAVFSWFMPNNIPVEENLNFKRETPDNVIINVDKDIPGNRIVMFKEVAASGWKVFLESGDTKSELTVLKAGPGWKLMLLPQNFKSGRIILTYGRELKDWFYISLSFLTVLGLLIFLTDGFFKGKILKKIKVTEIGYYFKNRVKNIKKDFEEEEDV